VNFTDVSKNGEKKLTCVFSTKGADKLEVGSVPELRHDTYASDHDLALL
jgi:hypothetical protein